MKPTDEQKAILKAGGRVVRMNARAGTGKTTTLAMVAEKHREKRLLYLVFNRKAMEEAAAVFPPNATVRTVHALAFRKGGFQWKNNLGYFSPADLLSAFKKEEQLLATIAYDFLTFFLNSPYPRLEDAVRPFRAYCPDGVWEIFDYYQKQVIHAARALATEWHTGRKPCPHDFYLKLFHKSGKFQRELDRYDLILVDEGQDLSPIMLDALRTCRKRLFLVGDSHQQIYSFRYAIDAMQQLPCDEEFHLTLSFRFGEAIAELASVFIQEAKGEAQFRIRGNRQKTSHIFVYQELPTASKKLKTAILSRSNVALFDNAMRLRAQDKPFAFEKDIYPLLMKTLDVYWLERNRKDKVRDPLIRSFHGLEELEHYAEETDNFQLQGLIDIVERYEGDFPDVIFEMGERSQNRQKASVPPASRREQARRDAGGTEEGIVLSTIHSAKGQEYDQVYIHADMAENLNAVTKTGTEHTTDEINVAYVGFTRAKQHLYLPPEFQAVLSKKWGALLKRCQEETPSKTKKKRPKKLRPGDRVYTSHGPGTILEIDGDYCLVDVPIVDMKLRQRLYTLREME